MCIRVSRLGRVVMVFHNQTIDHRIYLNIFCSLTLHDIFVHSPTVIVCLEIMEEACSSRSLQVIKS